MIKYEELPVIYTGECGEIPQDEWEKICEMAGEDDESIDNKRN